MGTIHEMLATAPESSIERPTVGAIEAAQAEVADAGSALAAALEAHAAAAAALTEWRSKCDAAVAASERIEEDAGDSIVAGTASLADGGAMIAAARATVAAAERGLKAAQATERRTYAQSELGWCRLERAKMAETGARRQAQYTRVKAFVWQLEQEDGLFVHIDVRVPFDDLGIVQQVTYRETTARSILAQLDAPPAANAKRALRLQ
jgi:hypothetical protein